MASGDKNYWDYSKETLKNINDINRYIQNSSEYARYFHFNNVCDLGRFVDFGGRIGENSRWLEKALVIEVDKSAQSFMKRNKIAYGKSLEKIPDGSLDVIYASHVLEHLETPILFIRLFKRKLRKGGRVIIVLPAEGQNAERNEIFIDKNGHLQAWNFATLATLLSRVGFKPIRTQNNYCLGMNFLKSALPTWLFGKYAFISWKMTRARFVRNIMFVFYWSLFKPVSPLISRISGGQIDVGIEHLMVAEKNSK